MDKSEAVGNPCLKIYLGLDYIGLLLDGRLNEYLHGIDEECYEMMDWLVEHMKPSAGITEGLKVIDQMKWVGLINNVRSVADEIVLKEFVYVWGSGARNHF